MLLPFLAEERQHLDAVCSHHAGQGCSRVAVWLNADFACDAKLEERFMRRCIETALVSDGIEASEKTPHGVLIGPMLWELCQAPPFSASTSTTIQMGLHGEVRVVANNVGSEHPSMRCLLPP